ncbi:hypothetical protein D8I35_08030 [Corticibacter populi]|uniref:Cysteine-rich CWC family protein n=1 Tax=Corticibacter populi TaxID=1550736 RepID=A0A3M6QTW1_9BURK|nr:cysteine-rich CWC family protein [Corticibacter populi]RMX06467.1 hypothetical protein D8I35_08030 [Corticibacter populi]
MTASGAGQCPLCGQPNQCAVAAGLAPAQCWCMQAHIAPVALARARQLRAPGAPARQCICPACGACTEAPDPHRQSCDQ